MQKMISCLHVCRWSVLTALIPAKLRALHLVKELSPAMGLHVNMAKCELFSMKGPQCTNLGLHAQHNKYAEF